MLFEDLARFHTFTPTQEQLNTSLPGLQDEESLGIDKRQRVYISVGCFETQSRAWFLADFNRPFEGFVCALCYGELK